MTLNSDWQEPEGLLFSGAGERISGLDDRIETRTDIEKQISWYQVRVENVTGAPWRWPEYMVGYKLL